MNWNDILQFAKNNLTPPRRVEKTEEEWKVLLTLEQFKVARKNGTEVPFSGEYCESYSPGIYNCICCGTQLFDSTVKFNSYTGWPSFTGPVQDNVIQYKIDRSLGMQRVEVLCNVCDAHLGHVFPDGPQPSRLRFCINSVSLKKDEIPLNQDLAKNEPMEEATLGGGCFWCTEAILEELDGITSVESGYAGGRIDAPTYHQVSSGNTGHAEVTHIHFNPEKISYADLVRMFMASHDPTSLNRQGADVGTQYRSIILFHNESQEKTANEVIKELQPLFSKQIVTEVAPFTKFFKAEESHQEYYRTNPNNAYCRVVIEPKLQKFRKHFGQFLKKNPVIAK